jgi:tRNA 5-methylaminomethyl-2-thiouridine biosynthesis bifunctional protein
MKTTPIHPAQVDFTAEGTPYSPRFGDVYHSQAGAWEQARHVFLAGNGLPQRWAGRERFVVLETGFGLGNNFLATWQAWRDAAPSARCERLVFVSVEKHPLQREALAGALAGSPQPALAQALVQAWPPLTPDLHRLEFEAGRVQLLLAFGDIADWLPELVLDAGAFYLDGFAPARNPDMWQPRELQRLGRLAAPGATAATWSVARGVRDALSGAGFEVNKAAGFGGKRDMTVARFAPRFTPQRAPAALRTPQGPREALVVGAGLAGCAAAWALARQGWHCRVFDREPGPALATSSNEGGLFHGTFQGDDGLHARWHRAAALRTEALVRPWIAEGLVTGSAEGFIRLEGRLSDAQAHELLAASGLPAGYLQWLDAAAAREASGLALPHGGWFYPGGGWLAPRTLAATWLARAGASFEGGLDVSAVRRQGRLWQLLDAAGRLLAEAPVVVLANALNAADLALGAQPGAPAAPMWPLSAVRGQTTLLRQDTPGLRTARLPVSGAGYVLPPFEGWVLCGATSQHHDTHAGLRGSDHAHNLQRLAALCGSTPEVDAAALRGRVGWRLVAPDRLPLVGAVPDLAAAGTKARLDQPRFVPRLADEHGGLYVLAALGSRGITTAALAAEVLASWITGAPCPVGADLRDALDAARFVARARRRTPAPA